MLETPLPGSVSRSQAWQICSAAIARGAGGVHALAGALDDQFADELGQGREDVEDQPTRFSMLSGAAAAIMMASAQARARPREWASSRSPMRCRLAGDGPGR